MKKFKILVFLVAIFLSLYGVAYAGYNDADNANAHESVQRVYAIGDISSGNTLDPGDIDTWNFEESAPDSLTSYAKATPGIVYGWKVTTLAAGTHAIAYLYDGNYTSGNVKLRDELYVNSTHFDNHYSWPFGAIFTTEISVTRNSITDINVFVYYR